jgi:hypothetical protein
LWYLLWNYPLATKYQTEILNIRQKCIYYGPTSAFKFSLQKTDNCYKNGLLPPHHCIVNSEKIYPAYVDIWDNVINENNRTEDFLWTYRLAIYDYQSKYINSITNATVREQLLMLPAGTNSKVRCYDPISRWNQTILDKLTDEDYNFQPLILVKQMDEHIALMVYKLRVFYAFLTIVVGILSLVYFSTFMKKLAMVS